MEDLVANTVTTSISNGLRNGGFGALDWGNWVYGIFAGFIGGGASAVTSGITLNMVDGQDFNIYTHKFYVMTGAIFIVNGTLNMLAFLSKSPLPTVVTKTVVEKTEEIKSPPAIVRTKVEQTKTEPAPVPPVPEKKE